MYNGKEGTPFAIVHKDGNMRNDCVNNLEWVKAPILVSEGVGYGNGLRSVEEIYVYKNEALDKAWLDRTHSDDNPDIEVVREQNVNRIRTAYSDIPENGYTNWESGYWNGILSALRWVLGEDRDFLDA